MNTELLTKLKELQELCASIPSAPPQNIALSLAFQREDLFNECIRLAGEQTADPPKAATGLTDEEIYGMVDAVIAARWPDSKEVFIYTRIHLFELMKLARDKGYLSSGLTVDKVMEVVEPLCLGDATATTIRARLESIAPSKE